MSFSFLPLWAQTSARTPVTNPEQVRTELDRVLAEPEFHQTYAPDIFSQLGQWALSWMDSLQGSMRELGYLDQLSRLSKFVMWAVLLLSIVSLLYWGVKLILNRRQLLEDWVSPSRPHFEPPAAYEPRIAEAAGQGQWSEAVLQSWRRFLSLLEQASLVEADRTKTNREYLDQLTAQGLDSDGRVRKLVTFYDSHIYGKRSIAEADWQRWDSLVEEATNALALDSLTTGAAS